MRGTAATSAPAYHARGRQCVDHRVMSLYNRIVHAVATNRRALRDYEVFEKHLAPLIEQAHEGAKQHVGKVPATAGETIQKQADLLRLRRELQDAVEKENYELAARVRDQIQILESA